MTAPDLDALERLRTVATPTPWCVTRENPWSIEAHAQSNSVVDNLYHVAMVHLSSRGRENAALIVAAVNALPVLIAELRAARHAITLLLDRVEDIGCANCHRQHRTANPDGKPPCKACAEAIAAAAIAKGTQP